MSEKRDDAGSSTDQHITGAPETGDSPVDAAPTATTPSHGSSNASFNAGLAAEAGERPDREQPEAP
ncbi:hypothetical protein AB0G04_41735 [Actinoplanes sp. NPDC023801]|uniref:hypothetical protein n=1 Tax=Actinoplanes sp. NPDC023801 TaxID=3154595 RepID=UPI003408E69D